MTSKTLLRISAGLCAITFIGHTLGMIQPVPPDQLGVLSVYNLMKETVVMLPMGAPKTIAQLMVGANACLSVFLFVAAAFYFLFAGEKLSPMSRRQLAVLNLGLFVTGIISWICFFPMPAICTGLAGVLGFVAAKSKS